MKTFDLLNKTGQANQKDTTANFKYIVHANGHCLWFHFRLWCDVFRVTVGQNKHTCNYHDGVMDHFKTETAHMQR